MKIRIAALLAALGLFLFAGAANAAGDCWLVVYGMFSRAEFDTAKALVEKIGEGIRVVDTDEVTSLPDGRFAVVSGPYTDTDADMVQENTKPVAPNALIVQANDCDGIEGVSTDSADQGPGEGEEEDADVVGDSTPIELHATVVPVGKWPEGLATTGRDVWVALSGQRQIAKIDGRTLKVGPRVNVGRLPVDMGNIDDVRIAALVQTDKTVWQQYTSGAGKSGVLGRVGDCPQAMATDDSFIWVATYDDCTSAASHVFQIDKRSGKTRKVYDLRANVFDIAAGRGGVFTIHADADESIMSAIDPDSGDVSEQEIAGTRLLKINASDHGLFAAGMMSDVGVIVSLAEPMGQVRVNQPIRALTVSDDGLVIAVGEAGAIYVLGNDLSFLYEASLDVGQFEPHDVLAMQDRLYISTFKGDSDGRVLVVDGWRQVGD